MGVLSSTHHPPISPAFWLKGCNNGKIWLVRLLSFRGILWTLASHSLFVWAHFKNTLHLERQNRRLASFPLSVLHCLQQAKMEGEGLGPFIVWIMPMSTYPHSQALVQEPGNEDNVYVEKVDRGHRVAIPWGWRIVVSLQALMTGRRREHEQKYTRKMLNHPGASLSKKQIAFGISTQTCSYSSSRTAMATGAWAKLNSQTMS